MQGKTINGYTLQRLLGMGGMAEVWLAENAIGKKAAVKLLLPKFCQDETIVARFENEAKVMVQLDHPNIRQVYDYGNIDGRPCIVMEYLEGNDLKALMKSGKRFTETELRKWWNQIADALNYTHAEGIVHRDIKPSNLFLDKKGNIKLLDFGIAKIRESISMTQTGAMIGTLLYMSPEQVEDAKHIGAESDIYSLAVTFVHLLTGKAPYDTTTSSDYKIRKGIVELPLDLSDVPADWQGFLAPYLEKNPEKRAALRPFEATTYTPPTPVPDANDETIAANTGHETPTPPSKGAGGIKTSSTQNPHNGISSTEDPHRGTPPSKGAGGIKTPLSPKPKNTPKKKGKKGLWIGLGVAAAVFALIVMFSGSEREEDLSDELINIALNLPPAVPPTVLPADPPAEIPVEIPQQNSYNGHEYVDLGLPSGTLWATCNMGASKPEGYGNYYAWGETQTKSNYSWETYKYANGDSKKLTKYCNKSDYGNNGFTDKLTALQGSDDPATAWGSGWRTPTMSEWDELLKNTTNKWTTQNGVKGRLFTAKNGQTLFLPAAGYRVGTSLIGAGTNGYYWSSSLGTEYPSHAWSLGFYSGNCSMYYVNRDYGQSVRPVRSARQN